MARRGLVGFGRPTAVLEPGTNGIGISRIGPEVFARARRAFGRERPRAERVERAKPARGIPRAFRK